MTHRDFKSRLVYHGFPGAAWLATYASRLLALSVCVLRTTLDSVPLSGDYKTARVLFYIFERDVHCELQLEGRIEEFFVRESPPPGETGWTIDTESTNLTNLILPPEKSMRRYASIYVRSLVHNFTEVLANSISSWNIRNDYDHLDSDLTSNKLVRYSVYCLPAIRRRAQRILGLFGFDGLAPETYECCIWRKYMTSIESSQVAAQRDEHRGFFVVAPVPGDNLPPTTLNTQGTFHLYDNKIFSMAIVQRLAEAASLLAFTNWSEELYSISVSFLEFGWSAKPLTRDHSMTEFMANFMNGKICSGPHNNVISVSDMVMMAVDVCSTNPIPRHNDYVNHLMLAIDGRGVIVAKKFVMQEELDMEACFIFLMPGAIAVNGERRRQLESRKGSKSSLRYPDLPLGSSYKPKDLFPTLQFSSHVMSSGDKVWVSRDVFIDEQLCDTIPLYSISDGMLGLLVTKECPHQYYNEIRTVEPDLKLDGGSVHLSQRLSMNTLPSSNVDGTYYLHPVDQNPCGQWLATYYSTDEARCVTILQRNACTRCTLERAQKLYHTSRSRTSYTRFVSLIPGRLLEESMK